MMVLWMHVMVQALTCPEEQCVVHPSTNPWITAALMARPAILHSACTTSTHCNAFVSAIAGQLLSPAEVEEFCVTEVGLYLDKQRCLLQLVLRDAILEVRLDMDDRSSSDISIIQSEKRSNRQADTNNSQAVWIQRSSSGRYMHHQRVVHVDPERELLLARHPPQIHRLHPVKNQPEIALCTPCHH
jgi:hypothetical protein